MVDIISKRSGPRREDVVAKRLINENRPTIERLANQLSGGKYAAMRRPPEPPQLDGLVLHDLAGSTEAATAHRPYVRVSLNGRVVVVDGDTNKQLHFVGEIRDGPAGREFFLATPENRFFALLDQELVDRLVDVDHMAINADCSEEDLVAAIGDRLDFV